MYYFYESLKLCQLDQKMDNKLDDRFLIMQYLIDANKKYIDKKMKKQYSEFTEIKYEFTKIKTVLKQIMVHNQHPSP